MNNNRCTAENDVYMYINGLYRRISQFPTILLRHVMAFVLVALLSGCDSPPGFHATDITGASFGRLAALDGLAGHDGRRFASADFRGKATVVFFGYTFCPDVCPTALAAMKEAMALLGPQADRVQVLFVTVDPERDTAEVLKTYVPWFDARFLGLRGDAGTTLAAAKEFRVFYSKFGGKEGGSAALDYTIDHSATSYAHDPQGRIRLLIKHGESPRNIADDLKLLLAGK
jgi:protein SCO1/2